MHESLKARDAIEKYLKFDITAQALRLALGKSFSFERNASNFSLSGKECESVIVGLDHVSHAIELALRGSIAPDALQEWANFVLLCDECELERVGRAGLGE